MYQPIEHAKLAHHLVLAFQAEQYCIDNIAKATEMQGEQNTKVHVAIHLQAAYWAAGFVEETVMTSSLRSVCCSSDA